VKCIDCQIIEENELLNSELQKKFWEKRIVDGHLIFGKDAINAHIYRRGRTKHLI
jgi:hypothetical protein